MGQASTIYKAKRASSLLNPTAATTFKQADDATKAAAVYFPVFSQATAPAFAAFKFRAMGRCINSASHNLTPKVSYGVSATAGSNTIIAAGAAVAVTTTMTTWCVWGELFWDSTSQVITGHYQNILGETMTLAAPAVLTAEATGVDFSQSGLGLSVECTIATGGGDTAYLDELSLEVI